MYEKVVVVVSYLETLSLAGFIAPKTQHSAQGWEHGFDSEGFP